ncbi:MAG: heavy metal-binding domain-containing protein [Vicinamibacterales bacterium]
MPRPGIAVRAVLVLGCLLTSPLTSFHGHAQEQELPPLVYVCPMHGDQVSDTEGTCPICHMDLEPKRLDQVYTCPIHSVVSEHAPGTCPICGRTLGPITVSIAWRCSGVDKDLMEPQACADGTPAVRTETSLAHGNHNAQYGGQFFMAADSWHHLEGVYPSPGVFRLYLYDDFTKPLAPEKIAATKARLVLKEETDPKTYATREVQAVALTPSSDGPYLEATFDTVPLPASLTVQAVFDTGGKEQRFDFTFAEYSVANTTDSLDPATRLMQEIPDEAPGVLKMLVERRDSVKSITERGAFSEIWVPALQAKDLALALELFAREFPEPRRIAVETATRQIVLAAFRLDAAGDLGNREDVEVGTNALVKAVADLEALFGASR